MAFNAKPRFHMGVKMNEQKENLKVPGAGTYNPDYQVVSKSLPKYTMKGR
jgi:hypothetical protein